MTQGGGRMDALRACEHPTAGPRMHRCPECGGTLRRCCDSLVGSFPHRAGCRADVEAESTRAAS